MADFDGQGHLLSLKVMRVSRPGLASAWEPFYSSSSSFSARSTASILSLQGKTPLPGHPKTLRDLSHASEFLTLPTAFGAIQLGETFSSCLCVNNEANTDIEGVNIKVEMQTANSKVLLAEVGAADRRKLVVGDVLEVVVHHEVKELGQHVLACTVSYRLPPGFRHTPPGPVAEGASDPNQQGFRKYYKFVVTNPLSVKTKVHLPRSPSALLDPVEREKVFLEVHIQNTTQEPMWFERIDFDCAEGWTATDMNKVRSGTDDSAESTPLFSGSVALMQPQATRQYIYVLLPTTIPTFPAPAEPGSVISLGRLDISWRTHFGEPGRLLTAMLTRRIPGPPPPPTQPLLSQQQPASAIPPYLQRGGTPSSPRLQSPQLPPSRSASPGPHRPASPFRNRPAVPVPRPQSPAGSIVNIATPISQSSIGLQHTSDVWVDLVATRKIQEPVHIYDPFTIEFKLTVSASAPRDIQNQTISIVVQHLRPLRASGAAEASSTTDSGRELVGGFPASPHTRSTVDVPDRHLVTSPSAPISSGGNLLQPFLPPPHFGIADQTRDANVKGCIFVGPSSLALEPIKLCTPVQSREDIHPARIEGSRQFELTFLALQTGYICAGGLRILVIDHELSDTEASVHRVVKEPKTLREYDVVGEVWVGS